jgi:alpha-aminoadipate carrier protein LysW
MTECTECGSIISSENLEEGEILSCQDCGAELEVTGINPLTVKKAPSEQEDWGE